MLAVADLFRVVTTLLPAHLQVEVERDLPSIRIALSRLALEVLEAEVRGLAYVEAIELPMFPLMARLHHGVLDQLQWRVAPPVREGLRTIFRRAAKGDFDSVRKLLFAVASRKNDHEAALARFLLFQAIRLNLHLWTWNRPEVEAAGCIRSLEDDAQQILEDFLASDEVHQEGVRPLHLLIAEVFVLFRGRVAQAAHHIRTSIGSVIEDVVELTEATRIVRAMDAADAAVFRPGRSREKLGSQRISDRFPWHFPSANAVEKRRSRLRPRIDPDNPPTPSGERLVDLILEEIENEKEDDS